MHRLSKKMNVRLFLSILLVTRARTPVLHTFTQNMGMFRPTMAYQLRIRIIGKIEMTLQKR